MNLIDRLGQAPKKLACMGAQRAINLSSLVSLQPQQASDLSRFCHWTSQIIGQGIHFLAGTYASEGVCPQDNWVFWGPVRSPSGNNGESVFTAKLAAGRWHYRLCFHGDKMLLKTLQECVLHSGGNQRILGRAEHAKEHGKGVVRFEIQVPSNIPHAPNLLMKTQFGMA